MSAWGKSWGAAFGAAFGAITLVVLPTAPADTFSSGSGGGSSYSDAGQGYIHTEHGWVKLTKIKKVGAGAYEATVSTRSSVFALPAHATASALAIQTIARAQVAAESTSTTAHALALSVTSNTEVTTETALANGTAHLAKVEWISGDEIAILVDFFTI